MIHLRTTFTSRLGPAAAMLAAVALTACAGTRLPSAQPIGQQTASSEPPPTATPAAAPPTAAPPTPEVARENEQRTTESGTSFVVPAGWAVRSHGGTVQLDRPGADLSIALLESSAASADAAAAQAWSALRPELARRVGGVSAGTPREGWALARDYGYVSSPDEHRVAAALVLAQQDAGPFTVIVLDADAAVFGRRLADIERVFGSVRPPGYTPESFAGKVAAKLDAARVRELTAFVERARERARVPGAALSLVQDGEVVFEGGFGVRALGEPGAVGPQTLFMIASTTKALTSLLLARLVDEDRFAWQTPASSVYPRFALATPELTARVQMRHLLCACTGLPGQNLEWIFEFEHMTPRSVLELVSTMQPTTAFGETFQYSNGLAAAAGFIAGHALYPRSELGAAYDRAMHSRVLEPLSMRQTTFDFARALRREHASPHDVDVHGELAVGTMALNRAAVPMRPAGGAWSNVRDLARYLRFELAGGVLPDGRRHISAEALQARYEPYAEPRPDVFAGLGVGVETRWGARVISTGGIMPGFASYLVWLPEHAVGAVLLTNASSGVRLEGAFGRKLLELLFDGRPQAEATLAADVDGYHEWVANDLSSWSAVPDPAAVAALAPRYHSAALGELVVRRHGEETIFDLGGWHGRVASRKNADGSTTFAIIDPGTMGFEFTVAEREGKRALLVGDMQHEYVFLEASPPPAGAARRDG